MEILKFSENSMEILIHMTPEERLWVERIQRNRLWTRYIPPHLKDALANNILLDDIYQYKILDKALNIDKTDKRTRNDKGQEKHESRRCSECGR
jgi:hypothetical protein